MNPAGKFAARAVGSASRGGAQQADPGLGGDFLPVSTALGGRHREQQNSVPSGTFPAVRLDAKVSELTQLGLSFDCEEPKPARFALRVPLVPCVFLQAPC